MYLDENHEAYTAGFRAGVELAKSYMQIAMNGVGNLSCEEECAEHAYASWGFKDESRSVKEDKNSAVEYLKAEAKQKGLSIDVTDRKELCGKPIDLISNEGWALRWHTTNGTLSQFRDDENSERLFFPSSWLFGYRVTNDKCTIDKVEEVIPFIQEHIETIRTLQKKRERELQQQEIQK